MRHVANQWTKKTECVHGHPFDEANTRWSERSGKPVRICRACEDIRHTEAKRRRALARSGAVKMCPICQTEFIGMPKQIYCARQCAVRAGTIRKRNNLCRRCGAIGTKRIGGEGTLRVQRQMYCDPCLDALGINDKMSYLDIRRNHYLRWRFGITHDEYERLLLLQNNVCAVCRKPNASGRKLAVDHNHSTGEIRGLLCDPCNRFVISRHKDADLLLAAADYLRHPPAARFRFAPVPKRRKRRPS